MNDLAEIFKHNTPGSLAGREGCGCKGDLDIGPREIGVGNASRHHKNIRSGSRKQQGNSAPTRPKDVHSGAYASFEISKSTSFEIAYARKKQKGLEARFRVAQAGQQTQTPAKLRGLHAKRSSVMRPKEFIAKHSYPPRLTSERIQVRTNGQESLGILDASWKADPKSETMARYYNIPAYSLAQPLRQSFADGRQETKIRKCFGGETVLI